MQPANHLIIVHCGSISFFLSPWPFQDGVDGWDAERSSAVPSWFPGWQLLGFGTVLGFGWLALLALSC
ncbi:hypothetical protein HOY82DRAFT_556627 [Tuber indicum]|nr:hypothetical protein HOY82DRAFT_556627 [Tuber indicum]